MVLMLQSTSATELVLLALVPPKALMNLLRGTLGARVHFVERTAVSRRRRSLPRPVLFSVSGPLVMLMMVPAVAGRRAESKPARGSGDDPDLAARSVLMMGKFFATPGRAQSSRWSSGLDSTLANFSGRD